MERRDRLAGALAEWARDEMRVRTVPDPARLAILCKGNGENLMRFLVENVRSSEYVRHVRDNLRVYGKTAADHIQSHSRQTELATKKFLSQAIARANMDSIALSNEIQSLREELSSQEQRDQPFESRVAGALTHLAHVHIETAALENLINLREKLVQHDKNINTILRPETPAESLKRTGEATDAEKLRSRENLPSIPEKIEATDTATHGSADDELADCESDWSRRYRMFRSSTVGKARRRHIQMSTAVHQTATERRAAEVKLSAAFANGPEVRDDVPASVLKAFIDGEQAAANSICEQGDQIAIRIQELRDDIENSVGVLARAEKMERVLEQGAAEAHGCLSKFDNLHTTLLARSEDLRAQCRSLTESLSASVTNLRDLQTSVHKMVQASRAVENTDSSCKALSLGRCVVPHDRQQVYQLVATLGVVHPVARASKLLVDRESLSMALEMIAHVRDQLSRDIRRYRTIEKGQEALASLAERSKGMTSADAQNFSAISQMVNGTIPRLVRECSDALAIWWDQPARGSSFWKEADAQAT